jgi:YVTN family beta-propeller protein
VANEGSNNISVIDAQTNQVTATIPTGGSPNTIAIMPNGYTAYVSNLDSGTLTILDLAG